jgi:lipoyl(octanoyl) transferase
MITNTAFFRFLGVQDYATCWQAMKAFTDQRHEDTLDEIWLVEHPAVFTQGQNGKAEHLLQPGSIPVIQTDRGGQITYHGPGQLVVYTLIDVKRKKLNIRQLVTQLEQSIIQLLAAHHISAESRCQAPGVYVNDQKICSVGLRIRRGCAYHGLAFNIDMDLEPFSRIHPCGYSGLKMIKLSELLPTLPKERLFPQIQHELIRYLAVNLGYTTCLSENGMLYGT